MLPFKDPVEPLDQTPVVAGRFNPIRRDPVDHQTNDINRLKDSRYGVRADFKRTVPERAQNILPGVRNGLETAETQEATGPLDGMDQPEDVAQQLRVIRMLLERDELAVERLNPLARLRHELLDDIVHAGRSLTGSTGHPCIGPIP